MILGAVKSNVYGNKLWIIGLLTFFGHPIAFEFLLYVKAIIFRNSLNKKKFDHLTNKFPIVYSPGYNITACGLEKLHPFDSCKYKRVFESLIKKKIIDEDTQIHEPAEPTREFLLEKMSPFYLFKLCYSLYICKCLEVPLFFLPAWFLRMRVLDPMLKATQGSVDAAIMAFDHGWAINLSGGYHHANCKSGGGFCIYPDITFIVHFARKYKGIRRVLIIDLDAH